jgi:hypothetical protein
MPQLSEFSPSEAGVCSQLQVILSRGGVSHEPELPESRSHVFVEGQVPDNSEAIMILSLA